MENELRLKIQDWIKQNYLSLPANFQFAHFANYEFNVSRVSDSDGEIDSGVFYKPFSKIIDFDKIEHG